MMNKIYDFGIIPKISAQQKRLVYSYIWFVILFAAALAIACVSIKSNLLLTIIFAVFLLCFILGSILFWKIKYGILKKYKVFLVLTCISAICNIIVVWMENKNGMALPATIFELAVLGLSIFVFNFKALYFFCGYSNLRFTGANETTGEKVVLIYEPIMNKLYTEEDYLKQFPFCK